LGEGAYLKQVFEKKKKKKIPTGKEASKLFQKKIGDRGKEPGGGGKKGTGFVGSKRGGKGRPMEPIWVDSQKRGCQETKKVRLERGKGRLS